MAHEKHARQGARHVVVQVLVTRGGHARRGGDASGRSQATKRWGLGAGSRHEGLAAFQEKSQGSWHVRINIKSTRHGSTCSATMVTAINLSSSDQARSYMSLDRGDLSLALTGCNHVAGAQQDWSEFVPFLVNC